MFGAMALDLTFYRGVAVTWAVLSDIYGASFERADGALGFERRLKILGESAMKRALCGRCGRDRRVSPGCCLAVVPNEGSFDTRKLLAQRRRVGVPVRLGGQVNRSL